VSVRARMRGGGDSECEGECELWPKDWGWG